MTHWKLLIAVPVLAAIAMVPQGESVATPPTEISHVVSISELQYRTPDGKTTTVSAKNVVEIRLIDDITDNIRLELYYENRDYSLVEVVGFEVEDLPDFSGSEVVRAFARGGGGHGEQLVNAVYQCLGLEGLFQVSVGAHRFGVRGVEVLEGAGQQQDGDLHEIRVVSDGRADLVATLARHHHVGEDYVGSQGSSGLDGVVPVVHGDHLEVFVGETDLHHLLDGDAVIGEQQGPGHAFLPFVGPRPQWE